MSTLGTNNETADQRIGPEVRAHFLEELRQGRLTAQKDAEAFDQLLFVFERLGCFLTGQAATLGKYQVKLLALAGESALGGPLTGLMADWHSDREPLYSLVNQARNDALHQGAGARHLTEHAIELALLFEDALVNGPNAADTLRDIMVRSPATAERWQPISFVRHVMLTNSFSTLPILVGNDWRIVTDGAVAAFLRKGRPKKQERARRLGLAVEAAMQEGLRLVEAEVRGPTDDIESVAAWFADHPQYPLALVCSDVVDVGVRRLIGIVTAFDIL
jgi:hypothetical protein